MKNILPSTVQTPMHYVSLATFFASVDIELLTLQLEAEQNFALFNERIKNFYTLTVTLVAEIKPLALYLDADEEELSKPVKHSLQRISGLVTDLQYHDIIRQKLEHVQQTNEKMLNAIAKMAEQPKSQLSQEWLPVLPGIVQLQAAMLDYTNIEYQRAFRKMKASLESFRENNRNISDIGQNLLLWLPEQETETAKATLIRDVANLLTGQIEELLQMMHEPTTFGTVVKTLCGQLKELALQLPLPEEHRTEGSLEILRQLAQLYTMQSERLLFERIIRPQKEVMGIAVTDEGDVDLF